MVNRGFRSTSAPTPTPLLKPTNNNQYIRRPTVVLNDERVGPSDKSTGAQAKVNQKFVSFYFETFSHRSRSLSIRCQVFDPVPLLTIERNRVFIRPRTCCNPMPIPQHRQHSELFRANSNVVRPQEIILT